MPKKLRHETSIADQRPTAEPVSVRISLEIIAALLERLADEIRSLARSLR